MPYSSVFASIGHSMANTIQRFVAKANTQRRIFLLLLLSFSSASIQAAYFYAAPPTGYGWRYTTTSVKWADTAQAACDDRQPGAVFTYELSPPNPSFNAPIRADCWYGPSSRDVWAGVAFYLPRCPGNSIDRTWTACYCQDALWRAETQQCMGVYPDQPAPGDCDECPSEKGGPPRPPSVGQPINPANGNMWHTEHDFIGLGPAAELSVTRKYNSDPRAWEGHVVRGFGNRWSHRYDAAIQFGQAPNPTAVRRTSTECFRWGDDKTLECRTIHRVPETINVATVYRGTGKQNAYAGSNGNWSGDPDNPDKLTEIRTNDEVTGWLYTQGMGDAETFDKRGRLLSITRRDAPMQLLTYSDGLTNDTQQGRSPATAPACKHTQAGPVLAADRLLCVTDAYGRQLNFEYDKVGRIVKTIAPNGATYLYAYDGPSGGCAVPGSLTNPACLANNLTSVTFPDGHSKTYYYNEAAQINGGVSCSATYGNRQTLRSMTGLVDENGDRHMSWTYDCRGKATSSQLADGVERVQIQYSGTATSTAYYSPSATVTHTLGDPASPVTTSQKFDYSVLLGRARSTAVSAPCVECGPLRSRAYHANGFVKSTVDWLGKITAYEFDQVRSLETSRIEAMGTAQQRTITTTWHPTYRLPLSISEPGRTTTFAYNPDGSLQEKTVSAEGKTRKWSYTYNAHGQIKTVTSPRTDIVARETYDYDADGNISTVTNAAGHITTYSNYDANGRVGRIVDSNGLATDLLYSERGWLTSSTVSGLVTTYTYDRAGQLRQVVAPGNVIVNYNYDAAHRLTGMADVLGNAISYTLDLRGNRLAEKVTDPVGALSRQTTRIFDLLSRVTKVVGAQE